MPWFEALGLVVFGFLVGTYGSMIGAGGGFLIVPMLLFLGYPARVAAGTSLAVVLVNALSSSLSHARQVRVDLSSGLWFALASIPGAVLGAYAVQHVPRHLFSLLFAAILISVALLAFFRRDATPPQQPRPPGSTRFGDVERDFVDAMGIHHRYRFNVFGALAVSAASGFLASMFGIGGGVVQVPAMVYLFHFPTHVAMATSQVIIAVTAFFGTLSHAYFGDILPWPALFLAVGAIPGSQLGARLAARMQAGALMRWFSLALVAAALYLVFRG